MINTIFTIVAVTIVGSHAFALDILCVNRQRQGSQITAHFASNRLSTIVQIGIPTGETSAKYATGLCVAEEGTIYLSLRCDNVVTDRGEKYFARIDGNQATIAKDGKVLATIPCARGKN